MYRQLTFNLGDTIEHEYKFCGRYGAKGEKRRKREKATPEQVKKQNQYNKAKYVRRLIKLNFSSSDYWITLKYQRGERPNLEQVKKDFKNFRTRLRRKYKKAGAEMKYIYRMEIGSQGGIHIHLLINAAVPTTVIRDEWNMASSTAGIYITHLYDEGGYEALADYIVKKSPKEVQGQLSLLPDQEAKAFETYQPSRNLIKPEPIIRECRRGTMRRIMQDGAKPTPGYFIDKDSIRFGVNEVTGYSYYYYTEVRITKDRQRLRPQDYKGGTKCLKDLENLEVRQRLT